MPSHFPPSTSPPSSSSTTLSHVARTVRGLVASREATAHVAVGIDGHEVLRVVTSDGPDPAIGAMIASDGRGEADSWRLITTRGAEIVHVATAACGAQTVGVAVRAGDAPPAPAALPAVAELAAHALRGTAQPQRDPLTGAMGRPALLADLEARLEQDGGSLGLLLCTIDNLESVIDSLGWSMADAVLRAAHQRLAASVAPDTPIARLREEEFALVVDDAADAPTVAERIVAATSQPVMIDGLELPLRASVGVATSENGDDGPTLLRQAHHAARRAHAAGGGRWLPFTREWQASAAVRLTSHHELARAVEHDELTLHFQPVVRTAADPEAIVGLEALVRWQHPQRGLVLPGDFVPMAEEAGLIMPLGRWVLEEACRRHVAWQRDVPRMLGVNISPVQLAAPSFVDDVDRALWRSGLPPTRLVLEITETAALRDVDLAASRLGQLRDLGVQVALDDFGTGYSSLTHLQRLPATIVKLDQSFVGRIGLDPDGTRMAEAVMALARTLGLDVVAEGVERHEQIPPLRALGCEFLQGYCLHPPMAPDAVDTLLAAPSLRAG